MSPSLRSRNLLRLERSRRRGAATGGSVVAWPAGMVAVIAAAVVLGLLITAVTLSAQRVATQRSIADNRITLRDQAGEILGAVFSVDADHWQADRARARGLVGTDFERTYGAQLHRPPPSGTTAVSWRGETTALVDVADHSGTALVRAMVTTRADDASESVDRHTLRAEFDLVDGRWLLVSADVIA